MARAYKFLPNSCRAPATVQRAIAEHNAVHKAVTEGVPAKKAEVFKPRSAEQCARRLKTAKPSLTKREEPVT